MNLTWSLPNALKIVDCMINFAPMRSITFRIESTTANVLFTFCTKKIDLGSVMLAVLIYLQSDCLKVIQVNSNDQ